MTTLRRPWEELHAENRRLREANAVALQYVDRILIRTAGVPLYIPIWENAFDAKQALTRGVAP